MALKLTGLIALINDSDLLTLNLNKSKLINSTKGKEIRIKPVPKIMLKFLKDGGVIRHFNIYGGFKF